MTKPYAPNLWKSENYEKERAERLKGNKPAAPSITVPTEPKQTLDEIDLSKEIALQYEITKLFLEKVLSDESTPTNQVAQVFNTISALLKEMSKTKTDVYNAERQKAVEGALISTVRTLPKKTQEEFFARLERALDAIGQKL